jgi:hypothetical protein
MTKHNFIPLEEYIHLIGSGKHQFACLDGDVYAQVYTPDLKPDCEVYLARVCKVCGNPFVDGKTIVEPKSDLETFMAQSEKYEPSFNHLHAKHFKTGKYKLFQLQPNWFLSGYSPSGVVLETFDQKEVDFVEKEFGGVPTVFLPIVGRRRHTEGSILLEQIYREHYENEKPIPPKLFQLISEIKGDKFYEKFNDSINNANKIGLKTKVDLRIKPLKSKLIRHRII